MMVKGPHILRVKGLYLFLSHRARVQLSPNAVNINMIADLYAEVNGVLAQSR